MTTWLGSADLPIGDIAEQEKRPLGPAEFTKGLPQPTLPVGLYSQLHRTFGYYGDGVSSRTAIMPADWRTPAREYATPDGAATALCPSRDDIAIAKLCAWREKDQAWLREAFRSGIARAANVAALLPTGLPDTAPPADELARRLEIATARGK